MIRLEVIVVITAIFPGLAAANIFDFFQQNGRGQQQHPEQRLNIAKEFQNSRCDQYLCPDTLKCVATKIDCPCQLPDAEIKCILPDKKNYICFSKDSDRDCKFVEEAYKGLV